MPSSASAADTTAIVIRETTSLPSLDGEESRASPQSSQAQATPGVSESLSRGSRIRSSATTLAVQESNEIENLSFDTPTPKSSANSRGLEVIPDRGDDEDDDDESSVDSMSDDDEIQPRRSGIAAKFARFAPKLCRDIFWFLNQARLICGKFVNNDRVQLIVVLLIGINAIMMGIATFDFVSDTPAIDEKFEICDKIFLYIFTVELCLQFLYHGLRLFLDGWLMFDFAIIVMSWAFSEAQIIRAFRIFRALRLVTRVEVMRNLVMALFSVMPRMAAIGLLLFLIFYIFAVMFTQLFKDMYGDGQTEYDYFSRLDQTFFTLFQIMTLDAWADVARDVMAVRSWAWIPFVAFVIISGFIVVNLIIAVICDAISALHDDDRAKLHGTYESESVIVEEEPKDYQQQQIKNLQEQVDELTRIQESTMMTLEYLGRQLQSDPCLTMIPSS